MTQDHAPQHFGSPSHAQDPSAAAAAAAAAGPPPWSPSAPAGQGFGAAQGNQYGYAGPAPVGAPDAVAARGAELQAMTTAARKSLFIGLAAIALGIVLTVGSALASSRGTLFYGLILVGAALLVRSLIEHRKARKLEAEGLHSATAPGTVPGYPPPGS